MRITKFLSVLLFVAAIVPAALGQVLQINGHFRGTPSGYNPVPGWSLSSGGGGARTLPSLRRGEFVLELTANRQYPQAAVSDLFPITGNTVTITAAIRGNGNASIGYETFDANRKRLAGANAVCNPRHRREQRVRKDYLITDPNAKYIRIVLTAQPRTTIQFREVTSALTNSAPPPPPPAAAVPPPPAPAPKIKTLLGYNHNYSWRELADRDFFQVTLPWRSEIRFRFQEYPAQRLTWSAHSANGRFCHVGIGHSKAAAPKGTREPVYRADIKIKAVARGQSDVVLVNGPKKVVIQVICR